MISKLLSDDDLFALVREHGLSKPLHITCLDSIEKQAKHLQRQLGAKLYYPVKTNNRPQVLQRVAAVSAGMEVNQLREVDLAMRAGVSPSNFLNSATNYGFNQVEALANKGINKFTVNTKNEVDMLRFYAPQSHVALRLPLTSTNASSLVQPTEKVNINELFDYSVKNGLKPYAIYFHLGSQLINDNDWSRALKKAAKAYNSLDEKLPVINIGGGLPQTISSYNANLDTITNNIRSVIDEYFPSETNVYFEAGRAVVANSSIALAEVIQVNNEKVIINASTYLGFSEMLENKGFHFPITSLGKLDSLKEYALYGNSCSGYDYFGKHSLPQLEAGDVLRIHNAGAYTVSMHEPYATYGFNGLPYPKEIFIGD